MESQGNVFRRVLSSRTQPTPPTKTQNAISGKFVNLGIFDPTRKHPKERPTDEEMADIKQIYYYPNHKQAFEKRRQIGMIEGLSLITRRFSGPSNSLEFIHLKKHSIAVKEWEPNIFIFLVYRHAHTVTLSGTDIVQTEWDESSIKESSLQAILNNLCAIFQLLHGKISQFIKSDQITNLRDILEDFVLAYFETIEQEKIDLMKRLEGFHYGPISSTTALSIQSFINFLKISQPKIQHICLIYDGYLLFNGLSLQDMKTLYCYLVCHNGNVSNTKLNHFPFGRTPTAASEPGGGSSPFGRAHFVESDTAYLMGSKKSMLFIPLVYLIDGSVMRLVILLYKELMLLILLDDLNGVDELFLESLKNLIIGMPGGLEDLIWPISQQVKTVLSKEDTHRFIYYNYGNNAIRKSNQGIKTHTKDKLLITHTEMQILGEFDEILEKKENRISHIALKGAQTGWLQGTSSIDRSYYLLLDNTKMTLTEAQEEEAHFAQLHFSNIYV